MLPEELGRLNPKETRNGEKGSDLPQNVTSGKRPCSCLHPHVSPWHPEAAGRAWAAPWDGGGQLWGAAQGPEARGRGGRRGPAEPPPGRGLWEGCSGLRSAAWKHRGPGAGARFCL